MHNLLNQAKSLQESIVEQRRFLHKNAEVGFELKKTVEFVENELKKMGIEPEKCGKSGITALIGGKKSGKVFLLRADMDALPIQEKSGEPFACERKNMHACGHDLHTAMLLGAAKILKSYENEIQGAVKLMFQPAEEIFCGSKDMIDCGVLENPRVDCALMIHVMTAVPFASGTVIVSPPGVSAPAADYFEIEVQGKGCHGSMPNTGVDPITTAAHIVLALQEIVSREMPMSENIALTVGQISVGNSYNVIPDNAVIKGSLRTYSEQTRQFIKGRLKDIPEGVAKAFRATAKTTFSSSCPTLTNDADLSDCIGKYLIELIGREKTLTASDMNGADSDSTKKSSGSEDFAYISQRVPSIMLALAAGESEKGFIYPQHHPMARFDESVLSEGSAILAYTAMRWLEDNK